MFEKIKAAFVRATRMKRGLGLVSCLPAGTSNAWLSVAVGCEALDYDQR